MWKIFSKPPRKASILFVDNGMAVSFLKVQQMALVNNVRSIPTPKVSS